MDNMSIKLFKNESDVVTMPSIGLTQTAEQASLVSEDIKTELAKETIKTIRLKEDTEIDLDNFILDLSDIDQVTSSQKEVIKALLSKHGAVSIYLYKKQGLIKLGVGEKYELERILPLIKFYVFNNEIKIYKNFKKGSPIEEVDTKDITKLRLHL